MLRPAVSVKIVAVTLHGGDAVNTPSRGEVRAPKRDVVTATKVFLQANRLRIASALPLAQALVAELLAFEATISARGHDSYEGRSGEHDDLLLALSVGLWVAEGAGKRKTRLLV
jgi:hypothetical protein